MPSQVIIQPKAARAIADRPHVSASDRPPAVDTPAPRTPATKAAAMWLSRQIRRSGSGHVAESGVVEQDAAAQESPSVELRGGVVSSAALGDDEAVFAGIQPRFVQPPVSSGFRSVDRLLPAGGLRPGAIVEWLADGDAAGAVTLAAAVACRLAMAMPGAGQSAAAPAAGTVVVVDRGGRFHPPAVLPWLSALLRSPGAPAAGAAQGGNAARPQLVVTRPARDDDELWAIDQSLRCRGVAAVLAWPRRVGATALRRWQLAARASGAAAMLVRLDAASIDAVRREPTWADARVAVSPAAADETADPAVRWLRLALVGGPWLGDTALEEPTVELAIDVARGMEIIRPRRHRPERHERGSDAAGGVACRAS